MWARLLACPPRKRWVPAQAAFGGGLSPQDWRLNRVADDPARAAAVAQRVPGRDRAARCADLRALACVHDVLAAVEVAALAINVAVTHWRCIGGVAPTGQFVRLLVAGTATRGRRGRQPAMDVFVALVGAMA